MRIKRKRDTLRSVNDKHTIELWDRMDTAFDALGDAIHATRRVKLIHLFDKASSYADELVLQETRLKWLARNEGAGAVTEYMGKAVVAEGTLKVRHVQHSRGGEKGGKESAATRRNAAGWSNEDYRSVYAGARAEGKNKSDAARRVQRAQRKDGRAPKGTRGIIKTLEPSG